MRDEGMDSPQRRRGRRDFRLSVSRSGITHHASRISGAKQPALTAACWLLGAALGPWSRPRPLPPVVRRAVFIRPCCLGDVLLTTAAVRAAAEALPGARLDYLVGRSAAPGLANNPRLAEVTDLAP